MNKEIAFFDEYAAKWDDMRITVPEKLRGLLELAELEPGERVLDVGSGTGVMIPYLLERIGESGKITAVDFSANMIAKAREKYGAHTNVEFVVGDVLAIELEDESLDTIICLNFFPHLHNNKEVYLKQMHDKLKAGGKLVIMHDISRDAVNRIHCGAEVVKEHKLPPCEVVGEMLAKAGYKAIKTYEDDGKYFVKGYK